MRTIDEKLHVSWSARLLGHVLAYVYFSSRPFGVKRFQTIHRYNVDVVRGLAPSGLSEAPKPRKSNAMVLRPAFARCGMR